MLAEFPVVEINADGLTPRGHVWAFVLKWREGFKWTDLRNAFKAVGPLYYKPYIQELIDARIVATTDGQTYHLVAPDALAAPIIELPRCFAPAADRRRASIHVPSSTDGVWQLIVHYDKKRLPITRHRLRDAVVDGAFSNDDLARFLSSLVRGGYIASADGETYQLLKRQRETPRLTQAGKPLAHAARANHLWRAMKMCGYFTARELAFAATMPDWPVSEAQADAFASELASAGYLLRREPSGSTAAVYRLKPRMNTGPDAPRLLRARFVWDPNLMRVVGAATAIEEIKT